MSLILFLFNQWWDALLPSVIKHKVISFVTSRRRISVSITTYYGWQLSVARGKPSGLELPFRVTLNPSRIQLDGKDMQQKRPCYGGQVEIADPARSSTETSLFSACVRGCGTFRDPFWEAFRDSGFGIIFFPQVSGSEALVKVDGSGTWHVYSRNSVGRILE